MYFAAFDLDTDDVEDVKELLGEWTVAAEQMCAGELVGGEPDANPNRPPKDTGEAWGYPPAGLTITFGFGASFFEDEDGGGQIGYGRTSSTSTEQETPRNLFGFKDGTANLKAEDGEDTLDEHVWVQDGDDDAAAWMSGGSYLMARKIRTTLGIWDRVQLSEQEQIIGRDKRFGAPLSVTEPSAEAEFEPLDLTAQGEDGPAIPADSHVAIVAPENNDGRRMLRRGYNYTDGNDSLGRLDAGLFFLAFTRDPRTGFYPVLERMTQKDALTEYLQHVGSALFAVLPGMREGDTMVGQRLFE